MTEVEQLRAILRSEIDRLENEVKAAREATLAEAKRADELEERIGRACSHLFGALQPLAYENMRDSRLRYFAAHTARAYETLSPSSSSSDLPQLILTEAGNAEFAEMSVRYEPRVKP